MKKTFAVLLAATLLAGACSHRSSGVKLASDTDSVAYVLGMNVGMNLLRMDSTLNVEALCEGIRDVFRGETRLTPDDARTFYLSYMNYALPEKARAYEEQFLADLAKKNRAYARTTSGVTYAVDEIGDQDLIPSSERDTIAVRWVIRTADGEELYSSYTEGDTLRMAVADLVKGLRESVKLIGRGGKISTWLPSSEAYGAEGDAELGIAPNATLHYEIELLEVDKYANRPR